MSSEGKTPSIKENMELQSMRKVLLEDNRIPDGTKLLVTLYNEQDELTCTFTNYYHSSTTYEQVFKEAGFTSFQWCYINVIPMCLIKNFLMT